MSSTSKKKPGEKAKQIPWTSFMDMHSGGGTKEPPYEYIYIQAPEEEAKIIFYNRFGHNPERVTCTCCGDDYSIQEHATLEDATGYQRNATCVFIDSSGNRHTSEQLRKLPQKKRLELKGDWKYVEEPAEYLYTRYGQRKLWSLKEYCAQKNVLVIKHGDISDNERVGEVPAQGYVWI